MHPAGAVSVRTSSALLAPVPADINQNRAAHAVVRLVLLGDQDFASSRVLLRLRDNYHTFMYAHTGASQSGRSWSGFLCRHGAAKLHRAYALLHSPAEPPRWLGLHVIIRWTF